MIRIDIDLKDVKKGMTVYESSSGDVELVATEDAHDTGKGIECHFVAKGSDKVIRCYHAKDFEHYGPRLYVIEE